MRAIHLLDRRPDALSFPRRYASLVAADAASFRFLVERCTPAEAEPLDEHERAILLDAGRRFGLAAEATEAILTESEDRPVLAKGAPFPLRAERRGLLQALAEATAASADGGDRPLRLAHAGLDLDRGEVRAILARAGLDPGRLPVSDRLPLWAHLLVLPANLLLLVPYLCLLPLIALGADSPSAVDPSDASGCMPSLITRRSQLAWGLFLSVAVVVAAVCALERS